jgi:hypothetical protein
MLEAVRGSSKYCGCRFSHPNFFSFGSQSVVLRGRDNPRGHALMTSFSFTLQDLIKRNLILIQVAMEFFRFSKSDSPNLLPSSV